jgi:DnaJ-class molecular chaperone
VETGSPEAAWRGKGAGRTEGDLYVIITVRDHPLFVRDGTHRL